MKRTAVHIAIPYVLGLLTASFVPVQLWIAAAGIGVLPFAAVGLWNRTVRKQTLIYTLSFLMACCVYWGYDNKISSTQLPLAGTETTFSGTVQEKQTMTGGYASYVLKGTFENGVSAYIRYFCDDTHYDYGDTLILTGMPEQLESSYLFDTAMYNRAKHIFLQMDMTAQVEDIPCSHPGFRMQLYRLRAALVKQIRRNMTEEGGAMLAGMLFGDTSGMNAEQKDTMYRMGIGHLLAVSGLHMDFLALCLVRILRKCRVGRYGIFFAVSGICLLFAVFVGGTVSVSRACMMVLITQGAALCFRKADAWNSLCIAMLLLCLKNPFVIHSPAFWLSCSGAFGISVLAPYLTKFLPENTLLQQTIKSLLEMCCVFLAVFPASVLYFRSVTLLSPISNLLLVPLCMAALLCGMLSIFLPDQAARLVLAPADLFCQAVQDVSGVLSKMQISHIRTNGSMVTAVLAISLFCILVGLVLYKSRRLLACSCVALVLLCFGTSAMEQTWQNHRLVISMLGESTDCVLVIASQGEAVIVDMSGKRQAASYVQTCLESEALTSVAAVFFCKPKAESMSRYSEKLYAYPPESCWMLRESEKLLYPMAFGMEVVYSDTYTMEFHGAEIAIFPDMVQISYAGIQYVCGSASAELPERCDILEVFGTCRGILPECRLLVLTSPECDYVPDAYTYIGENNLQLTIADDGKYRIRRLYANT